MNLKVVILALALTMLFGSILQIYVVYSLTGNSIGDVSMCISGPPIIQAIPNLDVNELEMFNYTVNCTVPCNGDELYYSHHTTPTLNSFFINSSTGVINFTPQLGEAKNYYNVWVFCEYGTHDPSSEYFRLVIYPAFLGPLNFTGHRNIDNHSVDLNWSNVSDAEYYNIYYTSNISAIMKLDVTNYSAQVTKIFNISHLNWTDYNASEVQKRYYMVSAVKGGAERLAQSLPVGKFTFYYDAPISGTYGTLSSNRVVVYLNISYDAESFLQEIPSLFNPTMSRLDKSNDFGEYYTTHVQGIDDGHNFVMYPTIGYQLTVDGYFNHTIVGKVYNNTPYKLYYETPTSGTYGILATQWRGIYDFYKNYSAEDLLQEIPVGLNPTISRLDKDNDYGEYLTTHIQGIDDGHNFPVNLGVGYALTIDDYYNHTLCTGFDDCFR